MQIECFGLHHTTTIPYITLGLLNALKICFKLLFHPLLFLYPLLITFYCFSLILLCTHLCKTSPLFCKNIFHYYPNKQCASLTLGILGPRVPRDAIFMSLKHNGKKKIRKKTQVRNVGVSLDPECMKQPPYPLSQLATLLLYITSGKIKNIIIVYYARNYVGPNELFKSL